MAGLSDLIWNSRYNSPEYPVRELVGESAYLAEIESILKRSDNPVKFQINTFVKSDKKHPKPDARKVNLTRIVNHPQYDVTLTEDSVGRREFAHSGIGWHTCECSFESMVNLIKAGYPIRFGIKENGNDKTDYIGSLMLAFDVDSKSEELLPVEDLVIQLKGLGIPPSVAYYSPSASPDEGKYQSRLILRFSQFVEGQYDRVLELGKKLCEIIPGATLADPNRLYYSTILPDLVYSDSESILDFDQLCDRFIPKSKTVLEHDAESSILDSNSNLTRKQQILALLESKLWERLLNQSDTMAEAIHKFFVSEFWNLENLHKVSDPLIEYQWKASNPFSDTNRTKSSLTICYDSEELKPPYFIDGSTHELTGSIVDWFFYHHHNWDRSKIMPSDGVWYIWAFKVFIHFDIWLEKEEIQLFGNIPYFLKLILSKNIKYNEFTRSEEIDEIVCTGNTFDDFIGSYRLQYDMKTSTQNLYESYKSVASIFSYHPIKNRFAQLKRKFTSNDLIDLDNLAEKIFGTKDKIHNQMLKKWLLAAYTRLMRPGEKFDSVLVLQGKQGIGKTSFFEAIAIEKDWFTDSVGVSNSSKDDLLDASTKWIIEFSELATVIGKKEVGSMRVFISRCIDRIREPYGRVVRSIPRSFVFGATVNEIEFLSDLEGNRRFWIIPDIEEIDITFLKENIEKIWYSVARLYELATEEIYFSDRQIQKEINERNELFVVSSRFDDVCHRLRHIEKIGINDIFNRFYQNVSQNRSIQIELASVLKKNGWRKKKSDGIMVWINPNPIVIEETEQK